jgi:selenide,water dikinase
LLVGLGAADDAAVYRLNEAQAIIQTVDFFTPIVDDPYQFGAIAAANAMSDVYAMGGEVLLALNIAGFPPTFPPELTAEILRGGAEKVAEAGGVIAGGHTIDDDEPKYGLAVTGLVAPDRILTKDGSRVGDALVLTKKLGTGIVTTAGKADVADPAHVAAAVDSMAQLNRTAARLAQAVGLHGTTDITGFGLLGHAQEMAERSGVCLVLAVADLPFLPGAVGYADDWLFPAGTCRNEQGYAHAVEFAPDVSEEMQQLLYTPETSGGLLLAVPPERLAEWEQQCAVAGQPFWRVGCVEAGSGVVVV